MPKILPWNALGQSFLKVSGLVLVVALLTACSSGPTLAAQPAATSPAAEAADLAATSPTAEMADPTATSPALETPQPAATSAEAATPDSASAPAAVSLEIGSAPGATDFSYDKTALEAPAGSKITLKFTNNTKLKDEVGHNWVLVKPGQEASVLANAQAAGDDNDWLQEGDPGIIAHTALIEGESNDTITFGAPAPGTYTYLSTFPKQYEGGMKGTLTIK